MKYSRGDRVQVIAGREFDYEVDRRMIGDREARKLYLLMSPYFRDRATIIDVSESNLYRIDIDHGRYLWPDWAFKEPTQKIISPFDEFARFYFPEVGRHQMKSSLGLAVGTLSKKIDGAWLKTDPRDYHCRPNITLIDDSNTKIDLVGHNSLTIKKINV